MKGETKRKLPKKIRRIVTVGRIVGTAIVVVATVYTLIPKSEKIKGLNTDSFVK